MFMLLFVRRLLMDAVANNYTKYITYSHIFKRHIRKNSLCCALLLLFLLLLSFSGCDTHQIHDIPAKSVLPSHTFSVNTHPSLFIHNDSGSVALHTGRNNVVVVTATRHVDNFNTFNTVSDQDTPDDKGMQLNYDQQGNTISVEALNISNAALRAISIDFDVIVPSSSDIQIYAGYGSIDADGVHGKTTLESQDGDITVRNSNGPMTINSTNGSVSADNVQGTLSLTLNNGSVALHHVSLTGSSQVTAKRGSIDFNGSINPGGSYRFHTETGTIDLTLPSRSSFDLDAATELGSIENDFGSTHVGNENGLHALLHVNSDVGSIALHCS
jgi:hypothetical protein